MLRVVEILTRAIIIPGIWFFVCWNIPGIRKDILRFADLVKRICLVIAIKAILKRDRKQSSLRREGYVR